ncbi:MAG TPA: carbohydrate-binding module family 20 domain-containing protein [Haliangium sp.]|nr:carbohydrate-binding module family 20 domain-containing protein [Haliangium sp.]
MRNIHTKLMAALLSSVFVGVTGCVAEDLDYIEPGDELEAEEPGDEAGESEKIGTTGHLDFNGTAFVHLFEWRWSDIASECETFLGPRGFEAVQVSPPNEHINHSTWWARYQPVSYQIHSRSGTRAEFINMVQRCNAAGVAIYVDAVINHTAAFNNGGVGVAGTSWSLRQHPMYSPQDYHAPCGISNYGDRFQVQNCGLSGLPDLNTASTYVQNTIAAYLNDLRNIGVAGFRIDAGKHMAHGDIAGILSRAGNPYNFIEVIGAAGEAVQPGEYTYLGQVTEFGYSSHIGNRFKFGAIKDLRFIGDGKLPSDKAVVFVDNHDNQRGHGSGGTNIVTHKDGALYNLATAFMLAHPYGYPQVMSSYAFSDGDQGPPAPGGCSASGWVCEHRWTTIANMVRFRNVTNGAPLSNWWDNGNNRVAFGRGDKGFIAINKESGTMTQRLQTGLAAGTYCNIAAGDFVNGACTGPTITVETGGFVNFSVPSMQAAAIHIGAKIGGGGGGGGTVNVNFTCQNGNTTLGQSVYVVGNTAEIGNWSTAGAVRMTPSAYPTWTATIALPASRTVEWKCLKRDEVDPNARVEWESGANNVVTTPASGSTSSVGGF